MSKLNGKRSDATYDRPDRRNARHGKRTPGKPEHYLTAAQRLNRAVRHDGRVMCLHEQLEERDCDGDVYDFETACTGCRLCGYFVFGDGDGFDDGDGDGFDDVDPDCCETLGDVDADVRRLLRSQSASWLSA